MKINKVFLIIPVYNEEKYLKNFLTNLTKITHNTSQIKKILIIDDGSVDNTPKIIKSAQARDKILTCVTFKKNSGKGSAMRYGLNIANEKEADAVIYMDGDGQHDPKILPEFIEQLSSYPIVFGYRKLKKNVPAGRKIGNNIAGFIIRNVFGIKRLGDILCGYIAIRSDLFDNLYWYSNDYGVEAEISAIVGQRKIPFKEILVKTIYLDNKKGVNFTHALSIFLRIPHWKYMHKNEKNKTLIYQ